MFKTHIPSRILSIFTVFAVMFWFMGGVFVSVPQVQGAAAVFTNNNTISTSVLYAGSTNQLGLDITLPPIDADTAVDCNGTTNNTADCPGSKNGALVAGASLVAFVAGDLVCADDVNGPAAPTIIFTDSDGNCNTTAGSIANILGTALATTQYADAEAADSLLLYFNEGGAGWATGEDIVFDPDDSQKFDADNLDAVTVRNVGTAVDSTDITLVQLWADTGNGTFDTSDTALDSACAWDAASDWECDVANYSFTTQQRIFVTYDVYLNATVNRTVQMRVLTLADTGTAGAFNTGDTGIFFSNSGGANTGNHDGPSGNIDSASTRIIVASNYGSSPSSPPPPPPTSSSGGSAATPTNTETKTITDESGGAVTETAANDGSTATVAVEPGTTTGDASFTVTAFTTNEVYTNDPLPSALLSGGQAVFDVSATVGGTAVTTFETQPLSLTFTYRENQLVQGASENDLRLATFDIGEDNWYVMEDTVLNTQTNTLTIETTHLTRFALVRSVDVSAPSAPTNLSASVLTNGMRLSWQNPSTDFHHARIVRNTARLASNIQTTTYDDTTAASGVGYTYSVAAVDRAGNVSGVVSTTTTGSAAPTSGVRASSPDDAAVLDGDLVRADGDGKVWIVRKRSGFTIIRHFVDAVVPTFYGHLGSNFWALIRPVNTLGSVARPAAWVRCGDCTGPESIRVYEVNGDGTRHWMNMTWEQFVVHTGNSAAFTDAAIFEINSRELAHYTIGSDVRFQTP